MFAIAGSISVRSSKECLVLHRKNSPEDGGRRRESALDLIPSFEDRVRWYHLSNSYPSGKENTMGRLVISFGVVHKTFGLPEPSHGVTRTSSTCQKGEQG